MAKTKNAIIRYQVLDSCFRNNGKRYFWQDLLRAVNEVLEEHEGEDAGISKRTLMDDIVFMESEAGWAIPLERFKDGKRVYYRYTDLVFSINNMPLNDLEVEQLNEAVLTLSQFKGMPQFEWIQQLLPKLKQHTQIGKQSIISLEQNEYLKGVEYLDSLYQAVLYKKVLLVSYHPYDEKSLDFIFHPYYLKSYNNRWFVFGYNPDKAKYNWNLALDRISEIQELDEDYIENTAIEWDDYFDDMIGVTKYDGATIESVKLHFFGKNGKYVESKPLHGSQKSKWISENILQVHLKLMLNYELEQLLLSYGEQIQVISPKNLVIKIKNRLEKGKALYH